MNNELDKEPTKIDEELKKIEDELDIIKKRITAYYEEFIAKGMENVDFVGYERLILEANLAIEERKAFPDEVKQYEEIREFYIKEITDIINSTLQLENKITYEQYFEKVKEEKTILNLKARLKVLEEAIIKVTEEIKKEKDPNEIKRLEAQLQSHTNAKNKINVMIAAQENLIKKLDKDISELNKVESLPEEIQIDDISPFVLDIEPVANVAALSYHDKIIQKAKNSKVVKGPKLEINLPNSEADNNIYRFKFDGVSYVGDRTFLNQTLINNPNIQIDDPQFNLKAISLEGIANNYKGYNEVNINGQNFYVSKKGIEKYREFFPQLTFIPDYKVISNLDTKYPDYSVDVPLERGNYITVNVSKKDFEWLQNITPAISFRKKIKGYLKETTENLKKSIPELSEKKLNIINLIRNKSSIIKDKIQNKQILINALFHVDRLFIAEKLIDIETVIADEVLQIKNYLEKFQEATQSNKEETISYLFEGNTYIIRKSLVESLNQSLLPLESLKKERERVSDLLLEKTKNRNKAIEADLIFKEEKGNYCYVSIATGSIPKGVTKEGYEKLLAIYPNLIANETLKQAVIEKTKVVTAALNIKEKEKSITDIRQKLIEKKKNTLSSLNKFYEKQKEKIQKMHQEFKENQKIKNAMKQQDAIKKNKEKIERLYKQQEELSTADSNKINVLRVRHTAQNLGLPTAAILGVALTVALTSASLASAEKTQKPLEAETAIEFNLDNTETVGVLEKGLDNLTQQTIDLTTNVNNLTQQSLLNLKKAALEIAKSVNDKEINTEKSDKVVESNFINVGETFKSVDGLVASSRDDLEQGKMQSLKYDIEMTAVKIDLRLADGSITSVSIFEENAQDKVLNLINEGAEVIAYLGYPQENLDEYLKSKGQIVETGRFKNIEKTEQKGLGGRS